MVMRRAIIMSRFFFINLLIFKFVYLLYKLL